MRKIQTCYRCQPEGLVDPSIRRALATRAPHFGLSDRAAELGLSWPLAPHEMSDTDFEASSFDRAYPTPNAVQAGVVQSVWSPISCGVSDFSGR